MQYIQLRKYTIWHQNTNSPLKYMLGIIGTKIIRNECYQQCPGTIVMLKHQLYAL